MINIKEPCLENWDEFSPTEQGAFCGKCQINVIDFSVQSDDEIKAFFSNHAGQQMCGRFKQSQIDNLNIEFYNWDGQSRQTFQAKFILTLLIVFGLSLFSYSTPNPIRNNTTTLSGWTEPDSTINVTTDTTQIVSLPQDSLLNEIVQILVTNDIDFPILQEVITMGGFDGGPDVLPNILEDEITIDWEKIVLTTTTGICAPAKEENFDIDLTDAFISGMMITPVESSLKDNQGHQPLNKIIPITPIFSSQLVINENESTLLIHSEYTEKYVINIHNKNGKLINSVCNETLQKGNSIYNIDLNEYSSDDYYIVIASKSTHDIVKFTI